MIHLILLLALAAQNPSPDAVQHIQAGIAADKQGHHEAAIAEFQKATQIAPGLAAAYVDLGTVYMEEDRYSWAVPPLQKAIQLEPDIAGAQELLGYALLFQGYDARAIPHFQAGNAKGGLGMAQLGTGDLTDAITNLQAALQQHPNDPDLLYDLARAAGLLSKQAGDTLLAAHPDSARAHQALAENYWALQRATDAEKEYKTALQLRPDLPGAHLALGELYANTQQWPKAEQQFEAETKLRPGSSEAAYRLGQALLENGKIHPAEVELRRANELEPDMPETLYALGNAESLNGNLAAAAKSWNRLLELEKDSDLTAKAHFGLAGIYRKQGKTADAAREMQAFKKLKAEGK